MHISETLTEAPSRCRIKLAPKCKEARTKVEKPDKAALCTSSPGRVWYGGKVRAWFGDGGI